MNQIRGEKLTRDPCKVRMSVDSELPGSEGPSWPHGPKHLGIKTFNSEAPRSNIGILPDRCTILCREGYARANHLVANCRSSPPALAFNDLRGRDRVMQIKGHMTSLPQILRTLGLVSEPPAIWGASPGFGVTKTTFRSAMPPVSSAIEDGMQ